MDVSTGAPDGADQLKAVIVEDDTVSRTLLRGILRNCEIIVAGEASTGKRGADLIHAIIPDLVCLDIGLPDADGTELLRSIKLDCPGTNVVMVTGSADNVRVRTSLAGGAVGYIVKPFSEGTIRSTLRRIFPTHRLEAVR